MISDTNSKKESGPIGESYIYILKSALGNRDSYLDSSLLFVLKSILLILLVKYFHFLFELDELVFFLLDL